MMSVTTRTSGMHLYSDQAFQKAAKLLYSKMIEDDQMRIAADARVDRSTSGAWVEVLIWVPGHYAREQQ